MKSTDLWFSAFLKLKGYQLIDFEVVGRGKGKFVFEISEQDWKKERIAFFASDTSRLKQAIEELKDLLY